MKKIINIFLVFTMIFNASISTYAITHNEAIEKGKERQQQHMEESKKRQNNVTHMEAKKYVEPKHISPETYPNPALQNADILDKLIERLKIWLDILKDLWAAIFQVPVEFTFEAGTNNDDLNKELKENIKKGILDYAKVTVTDGFVKYTFYNKTNITLGGKEYEIGEIIQYNDNLNSKAVKAEIEKINNSSYKKSFSFKYNSNDTIPSDFVIKLYPVGDKNAQPITQKINLNYDWDNAKRIGFIMPNDVAENHWSFEAVVFNMTTGRFSGNEKGDFMPKMVISRGQFATVLGRIGGANTSLYTTPAYSDVSSDKYYAPYTAWAKEKNLFHLEDINKFLPDKDVTREEMAYILYNYIKMKGIELEDASFTGFTDEAEISDWAKEAVLYLAKKGVIKGNNGKFDPKGTFTREQVAQILYQLRGLI